MKRSLRLLALTCLSLLLLCGTALADMGPKPLLTVRVENAPEEPYLLDLLEMGSAQALHENLTSQELAAVDPALLDALLSAIPEGWHACLAQGSSGPPIWGDLTSPDGCHTFGYAGLPETYRILLVSASGEVFLSEPRTRTVLQSSVTVDCAAKTVSAPPTWIGYLLQFLATLVPTVLLEGLLLPVFGYSWRKNRKPFLLANLATQGALAVFCAVLFLREGFGIMVSLVLIPAELVIFLAEAQVYRRFFVGRQPGRAVLYALCANLCSALVGWFLSEPVWHFVVSIS